MRYLTALSVFTVLVLIVFFSGCTGTSPAPAATAQTTAPTAVADPYPDALVVNTPTSFGSGNMVGEINVFRYAIRPTYDWTDPSLNSPQEQAESNEPLEERKDYNTKSPKEGSTYLFVYVSVENTGSDPIWSPDSGKVLVVSDGKTYKYTPLLSSETHVKGESVSQYNYLFGSDGTVGWISPGSTSRGFMVYEVPASFSLEKTYVVADAGSSQVFAWKLA